MGRSKRAYLIGLLIVALAGSVQAKTPPQLDSLIKYTEVMVSYNVADSVTAMCVNLAVQDVCADFPALPKVDTVIFHKDSTGVALNSDFLRMRSVSKMYGKTTWEPRAPYAPDSLWLTVVGKSDSAKMSQLENMKPFFWYEHGRLYTHPRFNRGSKSDTFKVNYWAADKWLVDTTGSVDSTVIKNEYLGAVVARASYYLALKLGRSGDAAAWLREYEKRLGLNLGQR